MKVKSDLPPGNSFSIEKQPNKPGFVLARFYENVKPFERTEDGLTMKGFEYDEYHLELADTGNLRDDILNNYEQYFEEAKSAEQPDPATQMRADIEYISMMTGVSL